MSKGTALTHLNLCSLFVFSRPVFCRSDDCDWGRDHGPCSPEEAGLRPLPAPPADPVACLSSREKASEKKTSHRYRCGAWKNPPVFRLWFLSSSWSSDIDGWYCHGCTGVLASQGPEDTREQTPGERHADGSVTGAGGKDGTVLRAALALRENEDARTIYDGHWDIHLHLCKRHLTREQGPRNEGHPHEGYVLNCHRHPQPEITRAEVYEWGLYRSLF